MAYRNYSTAVGHIVDQNGFGDFTSIGFALSVAVAGETIFIRPGTYTENITLVAGVDLTAFESDEVTPTVKILGEVSFSGGGTINLSGISLATNGSFALSVTGSGAAIINLIDCNMLFNNSNAINYANTNVLSILSFYNCFGLAFGGVTLYQMSAAGFLAFVDCQITNSATSSTPSANSAGTVTFFNCQIQLPVQVTGSGALNATNTDFNTTTAASPTAALNFGGSNSGIVTTCVFASGSASAISVASGSTLNLISAAINSTNSTAAITGTGILNLGIVTFYGTSTVINTSTVNNLTSTGGTLTLKNALSVSSGGTGDATFANTSALLTSGTTSTGNLQNIASVAAGQVLISAGTSTLPSWSSSPTITSLTNNTFNGTVGSGSNVNAANWTFNAPEGTGTGTTGLTSFNADAQGGTTGSVTHTSVPRLVLNGFIALTSASAASLISITAASGTMVAGTILYYIECTDGTNFQSLSGVACYTATNKAGTTSGTAADLATPVKNLTSGTLTTSWALNGSGFVQLTATTSLTATLFRVTFNVMSGSQQAISVA